MNEKQLAKLIRKTTADAEKSSAKKRKDRSFDPTLQNRHDHDEVAEERARMFEEMRKREF